MLTLECSNCRFCLFVCFVGHLTFEPNFFYTYPPKTLGVPFEFSSAFGVEGKN